MTLPTHFFNLSSYTISFSIIHKGSPAANAPTICRISRFVRPISRRRSNLRIRMHFFPLRQLHHCVFCRPVPRLRKMLHIAALNQFPPGFDELVMSKPPGRTSEPSLRNYNGKPPPCHIRKIHQRVPKRHRPRRHRRNHAGPMKRQQLPQIIHFSAGSSSAPCSAACATIH